jgi:hypothetical protein
VLISVTVILWPRLLVVGISSIALQTVVGETVTMNGEEDAAVIVVRSRE